MRRLLRGHEPTTAALVALATWTGLDWVHLAAGWPRSDPGEACIACLLAIAALLVIAALGLYAGEE